MQKLISILIAVAFVAVLTPTASAAEGEVVDEEYAIGGGFFHGQIGGLAVMCEDFCWDDTIVIVDDLDGNEIARVESPVPLEGTIPDFGGAALNSAANWNSVVMKPNDDLFGTGAGISGCFFHPDGDNICEVAENPEDPVTGTRDGLNDFQSDWTCGVVSLVGAPWSSNEAITWALAVVVTEEGDACGAVHGTIRGEFFDVTV